MRICLIVAIFSLQMAAVVYCDTSKAPRSFLDSPPVYVVSEPDIPLTGLGIEIPQPGQLIPDFDYVGLDSDKFVQDGVTVQPGLSVKFNTLRIGFLRGLKGGWSLGLSMPWQRSTVGNSIGGQAASCKITAVGDMFVGAKKLLWSGAGGQVLVGAAGIELPTGMDRATFNQDNIVTNAYYRNFPRRMPLSWQAGSGSVDGIFGISYGRKHARLSYEALAITKINGSGDEDVHIGNITLLAGTATYGVGRNIAVSLGLTMRSQADDSYPNAPPPGVNQPALVGTTTHGTALYLDPSIRFVVANQATIGLGFRFALIEPDNGFVRKGLLSVIFYPCL